MGASDVGSTQTDRPGVREMQYAELQCYRLARCDGKVTKFNVATERSPVRVVIASDAETSLKIEAL